MTVTKGEIARRGRPRVVEGCALRDIVSEEHDILREIRHSLRDNQQAEAVVKAKGEAL
jgi:hypothetical protein